MDCGHFEVERPFDRTKIPDNLYHHIDWDLWFQNQNSMVLPLKSAVGGNNFLVRRVSAMNWPTFCGLFGDKVTAVTLNQVWLKCPVVRTSYQRGRGGGRWRQGGGKKGGKGDGKGGGNKGGKRPCK